MRRSLSWLAKILATCLLMVVVMAAPSLAHHSEKHNAKKQKHDCSKEEESESSETCKEDDEDSDDSSESEGSEQGEGGEGDEDESSDDENTSEQESDSSGSTAEEEDPSDNDETAQEKGSKSNDGSGANGRSRTNARQSSVTRKASEPKPLTFRAERQRVGNATKTGAVTVAVTGTDPVSMQTNALDLVITADKEGVQPGDVLSYTVVASNAGAGPITGLSIVVPIPDQTVYLDGSATAGGTFDEETAELAWEIPEIAVGGSVAVGFQVTLGDSLVGESIDVGATAVSGQLGVREAQAQTSILGAAEGDGDNGPAKRRALPRTGEDLMSLVLVGALLIALGTRLIKVSPPDTPAA